jgi:hypothetical protein
MTFFKMFAALIILYYCLSLTGSLKRGPFQGRFIEFVAFSLAIAALGSGAVGAALNVKYAMPMLLCGIAGTLLLDRRKKERYGSDN